MPQCRFGIHERLQHHGRQPESRDMPMTRRRLSRNIFLCVNSIDNFLCWRSKCLLWARPARIPTCQELHAHDSERLSNTTGKNILISPENPKIGMRQAIPIWIWCIYTALHRFSLTHRDRVGGPLFGEGGR